LVAVISSPYLLLFSAFWALEWGEVLKRVSSLHVPGPVGATDMAKFALYLDSAGYWRWRLVAGNGEKVAASEAYASYANASRSAQRVKEIAATAVVE
jgi:uncharacterized protein